MGNKQLLILFGLFSIPMFLPAQILAPRKSTAINLMVESGAAFEMMADNATHGMIHAGATLQLGKFLIVRASIFQGTKSRFNNLKSPISTNAMLETHVSPLNKMWGIYAAFDQGVRNYKFENLEQFDAETGASSAQPHPVLYTPDIVAPNAVMQYALPTYKLGLGWYINVKDDSRERNNQTVFQASFFGSYSREAENFGLATSDASLFNIDVPTRYSGNSNLRARTMGYGALFYLQTPQSLGGRMEIGMRPSLYKGPAVTNAATGFYFHFGLNFRLI